MNKKQISFIVLSSLILGGIGGWLMMRFFIPKLNAVSVLRKYNLTPKTSPLVINTREEVRVNEGSDAVAAIQHVKPWVVSIINSPDISKAQVQGAGIIITSDGLIGTIKSALPASQPYTIALSDGTVLNATLAIADPASDLVFLKVSGSNLPTASLGFPKDLQLGQRMIVLSPLLNQYQGSDSVSFLSSELRDINPSRILSSDRIYRTFGISSVYDAAEGAAVFSLDGNIQGLFSKTGIVTSDTIKSGLNAYFSKRTIQRPVLGINYQAVPKSVANLHKTAEGVLIKRPDLKAVAVVPNSPADKAGFQENDLITEVNGTQITFDNSFEELLANFNPGQTVSFTVVRGSQTLHLNATLAGQ